MAAHRLQQRMKLWDLDISIENAKGSLRHWGDPHSGEHGSTKMIHPYGYIRGSKGTDGDHVDVYVGPNHESEKVFVIDQMCKPDFKKFDEQKCMLGFNSAAEAKAAYLKHYNDDRFFGSMKEMAMDDFKTKVLDKSFHGKKVANGDMMQYFIDHPDKLKEKQMRDAAKKKTASMARLMTELNLTKTAGEVIPTPKAPGDKTPGVTILPAMTPFAEAMHTRADEHKADQEMKTASDGRAGRISDRLDDVGIGMLAAPYAADAASKGLMRVGGRNAKIRAAATALKAGYGANSHFGHSTARELTGLALVAPGVTHTVANRIDKTIPQKKVAQLEKIAQQLHPDFEYMTEAEKVAFVGTLGRMASAAGKAVGAVTSGAKGVLKGVGAKMPKITPATATAPKTPGIKPPSLKGAPSVSQPTPSAGGLPKPVTTSTPAPNQPKSKWNPLSGKNIALGTLAAAGGVGVYGASRAIQGAGHILQHQHQNPLSLPGTTGIGRAF